MSNTIAKNLRRIRLDKDMSQQEVADKAKISRTAYRNIESGASVPRVNTLLDIANALEVRLFDLFSEPRKLTKVRFN